MKNLFVAMFLVTVFVDNTLLGQALPTRPSANSPTPPQSPEPNLTKFNLDFPGGTPQALVEAIEKASSKPLNAVIPQDAQNVQLPPLKMTGVTVPRLFAALTKATMRSIPYRTGASGSWSYYNTADAFETQGPVTETSVWYFQSPAPPLALPQPRVCRYYQLASYLDHPDSKHACTVEDITTAIETGWKMLGTTSPPKLTFHKETKLLIAVGDPEDLKLIDQVLTELTRGTVDRTPRSAKS